MIIKTRGIVFQSVNYSDTSLIVKIFTETLGLQSYMVKGARSAGSKQKTAYFQPLSLLDLVVYHKENRQINTIKEIRSAYAYKHIPFDIHKQTMLLFLNEILYKSVREEGANKALFSFIYNSLHWFDLEREEYLNFHIFFLLQLTKYLGFYPKINSAPLHSGFFDLEEGIFVNVQPMHNYYISHHELEDFTAFLTQSIEDVKKLPIGTVRRRKLLDILISYYQMHLPGMGNIKSLDVLTAVLHG